MNKIFLNDLQREHIGADRSLEESFSDAIFDVVCSIPYGKVLTYGDVATLCGKPHHARLVGHILSQNQLLKKAPCHRVIHSNGFLSAVFEEQRALLEAENVRFTASGKVDMKKFRWDYNNLLK